MHVDIDKARCDDLACGIDFLIRLRHFRSCPGNFAVPDQQIQLSVHTVGRVDHMTAKNQSCHCATSCVCSSVLRNASIRSRPFFSSSSL